MAEGSAAKLTPFAKIFIVVVVVGVIGFSGWWWFKDDLRCWASPEAEGCGGATAGDGDGDTRPRGPETAEDFAGLANAPQDPARDAPHNVQAQRITGGRLNRPLRVGINTWAGHAPGIVANNGLRAGNASSIYMRAHNLEVELSIMDDPAAKLAAFQAGQIDVMWDTVDSWAREAAILSENNRQGRAIIMEDWSRGGDGIAAIREITNIEQLRGRRIATTQFTPSHWLLLYLLAQSGLTPQQREEVENNLVFAAEAPAAAAMFRAGRVDAAVTWEPDLSACIQGRGQGAHVLVSTTAATNVIADVLVARQEVIQEAPETIAAFVAGWFEGIEAMRADPGGTNEVIGEALNLDQDTVSGMLSGLKLTPFADNALFFGLTGEGEGHYSTLFSTAHRIWRRRGVISTSVRPADTVDTRFVAAVAETYRGQEVVEPAVEAAPQPSEADVPIINRQLSIHFTTGSAEIMPGSYFTLDALAETMVSFGGTVLRIEGNTDATGQRDANVRLSQARADSVRNYLVQNHDIPAERVQTIGYGPDRPIADNASEEGRMLNRRTDIRVVLAPSAAPAP
jgi:NitT/TauT family transport system substrate-binding protein